MFIFYEKRTTNNKQRSMNAHIMCVCVYMYVCSVNLDRIDKISLDCSLLQACENIDHLFGVCACIV